MKALIDTNIILDVALARPEFLARSAAVDAIVTRDPEGFASSILVSYSPEGFLSSLAQAQSSTQDA